MDTHIEKALDILDDLVKPSSPEAEHPLAALLKKRKQLDEVNHDLERLESAWKDAPLESEERDVGLKAIKALKVVMRGAQDSVDEIKHLSSFWNTNPDVNHIFGMSPNGGEVWERPPRTEPSFTQPSYAEDFMEPPTEVKKKASSSSSNSSSFEASSSSFEVPPEGTLPAPSSVNNSARVPKTNVIRSEEDAPKEFVVSSVKDRWKKFPAEDASTFTMIKAEWFDKLDLMTWTQAFNEASVTPWKPHLADMGSSLQATWENGERTIELHISTLSASEAEEAIWTCYVVTLKDGDKTVSEELEADEFLQLKTYPEAFIKQVLAEKPLGGQRSGVEA